MEICLRVNDTFIVHLQVDTQHSNNQNIFRNAFVELINTYWLGKSRNVFSLTVVDFDIHH